MSYIFLDESGDLGFNFGNRKTSRFFIVTCILIANKKPLEKIVKKTHSELNKKLRRRIGVLHSVKEKPLTRQRLLRRVNMSECLILVIFLNKRKVYVQLKNEKQALYNYVVNILLDRILAKKLITTKSKIYLVASKRETNKFLNENFKAYLKKQSKNVRRFNMEVSIKSLHEEKALQAVDIISWSIFRKYEYGDSSYYNLVKGKIVEENALFP